MPHSSGGGSHGGGSHGGGGYSGGSSSYSSAPAYKRSSKVPFKNCYTFVRYVDRQPVYLYSETSNKSLINSGAIYPGLTKKSLNIIAAVIIIISVLFGFSQVRIPKKLQTDHTHQDIQIIDNISIIDEEELMPVLKEFQDKTGITPVIYTDSNNVWNGHYLNLENYAYEYYVDNLPDETYWLIVYTEEAKDDGWNDWYWEGMQGDDTDPVLTENIATQFNTRLHNALLRDQPVTEALTNAFGFVSPTIMNVSGVGSFIIAIVIGFLLVVGWYITGIKSIQKAKEFSEYKLVSKETTLKGKAIEDTCDYCGGIYAIGAHNSCPHCGAALVPHDEHGNRLQPKVYSGLSEETFKE